MTPNSYDVAVVGAGLAGMTAAISTQQAGRSTILLERRGVVGGLCGTAVFDGYEFTIGCNDFGAGLQRKMDELGVRAEFETRRSVFHVAGKPYTLPPSLGTLARVAPRTPDLVRLVNTLRKPDAARDFPYLKQLMDASVRSGETSDLLGVLAYPLGAAPGDFPTRWLKESFSKTYDYGTEKTVVPVGGPRKLSEEMARTFLSLGGRLETDVDVQETESTLSGKILRTSSGVYRARNVISSGGRLSEYPEDAKACLPIGMIHLAVNRGFAYPKGVHTLAHFPPGVSSWLTELDRGVTPHEFGFHVFPCAPPDGAGYLPLNIYFLTARGKEATPPEDRARITSYIMDNLERILPGVHDRTEYRYFVSPGDYEKLHGLSSSPLPALPGADFTKPGIYDPIDDIHYVGNSVHPPGEHAGGAVLSGVLAARMICNGPGQAYS
jgi:phytoene dehydrogenase-like protein